MAKKAEITYYVISKAYGEATTNTMNANPEKYRYYPENPKKLELKEVLHKMRDLRYFYIFMIPAWIFWGSGAMAAVYTWFMDDSVIRTEEDVIGVVIYNAVILVGLGVIIGVYILVNLAFKNKNIRPAILRNIQKYIPETDESIFDKVQEDLYKGMPFLKNHNIGISENYIIGNLNLNGFNPVIIPRAEIVEVGYEIYEGDSYTIPYNGRVANVRSVYQNFKFVLRNGNVVTVQVNDKFKWNLALSALQAAGLKTVNVYKKNEVQK